MASFETSHQDMIHDVQPDFYGKRVATCSSDRTIRIFELVDAAAGGSADGPASAAPLESAIPLSELKGHEGPVWRVAWAHPKFGSVLASCGYDRRVIVWVEGPANQWTCAYTFEGHAGSVNSVAWAPHEFGLALATASSDGSIAVLTQPSCSARDSNGWDVKRIADAHAIGANAVSWSPGVAPGALLKTGSQAESAAPMLVSGGCDKNVNIWRLEQNEWKLSQTLSHHTDWVRDVAWAPNIGVPMHTIASGGQDGLVVIWTQKADSKEWEKHVLPKFPDTVWSTAWSLTGNLLAVSSGSDQVSLWRELPDGEWETVSTPGFEQQQQ